MQKVQPGVLEARIEALHDRLIAAGNNLSDEGRAYEGIIGNGYSVQQAIGMIAIWEETVAKGLREVQRRKKPMDLLRAIEQQDEFMQEAVEESAELYWDEVLIGLDDSLYQLKDRLEQFSKNDLNELKRHRWLGNRPLWPFISEHTERFILQFLPAIESHAERYGANKNV